ncbi:MAG: DUF1295 domain-containing protein [Bacteroidota bacterium]
MDIATFNKAIWIWIIVAVVILPVAVRIAAPYGRHTREGWGPMIDNKLGWIIMEMPALALVLTYFLIGDAPKTMVSWIIIAYWVIHYGHRTLIFPFMLRTKGKKMPVGIMFSAIFFNLFNSFFIGYYLGYLADYSIDWLTDPRFIIGSILFFTGMYINWRADYSLINLRKPGETGYKIPRGWLFKYISCPNHFGEIIEWLGFAILFWAMPGLSFFIWTFANLVPRTLNHHKWYQEKFADYPKERKAVFPFVL